jgi:hypothetical protein
MPGDKLRLLYQLRLSIIFLQDASLHAIDHGLTGRFVIAAIAAVTSQ